MGNVKENILTFEQYNNLQEEIDKCNNLISQLKKKDKPNECLVSFYLSQIKDNLGKHLVKKIGEKIIVLIEAEKAQLEAEQSKLNVSCD